MTLQQIVDLSQSLGVLAAILFTYATYRTARTTAVVLDEILGEHATAIRRQIERRRDIRGQQDPNRN